jgi:hypothetical protein
MFWLIIVSVIDFLNSNQCEDISLKSFNHILRDLKLKNGTIVNDESYYYPDLMGEIIVDGEMGQEVTKYTGSTTGTTRDNEICSNYEPITWQVDRKCHLISASSFDKRCADMKAQCNDMSDDLYAHGSREVE